MLTVGSKASRNWSFKGLEVAKNPCSMKHKAMIEKASVVFPCNSFQHTCLHADLKYINILNTNEPLMS